MILLMQFSMSKRFHFSSLTVNKGCRPIHLRHSNYLQNLYSTLACAFVFGAQFLNLFIYLIINFFQHQGFRIPTSTMIDRQTLLLYLYRRKDVLTSKRLRDFELLFQYLYAACAINFANVMNSANSKRQLLCQSFTFFNTQFSFRKPFASLAYSLAFQRRWSVILVPVKKLAALFSNFLRRAKIKLVQKLLAHTPLTLSTKEFSLGSRGGMKISSIPK